MEPGKFTQLELDLMRLAMESLTRDSRHHDDIIIVYKSMHEALNAPYQKKCPSTGE
jgi:hypothetical protein